MDVRTPWLTRGVRGIGIASFLSDLGHEVPTSLLPRFLTSLGGTAATLGLIEGVADGLAGFTRFLGGPLADDPDRRRRVAVGGYAATGVLSAAIGGATAPWQVGVLRAGAWAARGLRVPSRNALLADAVPSEAYGRAYGFERMADNLGAIGGPLLALMLVAIFDVRTEIMLSVVPGLLAVVAILYAVRHIPRTPGRKRTSPRLVVRPLLRARLGRLLAGVGIFELGNVAATMLILRATELLAPDRGLESATFLGLLLYLSYNTAATAASIPAGHIADRRGAIFVLRIGVASFLVAYVAFATAGASVPFLLVAFVLAGAGIGAIETAEHAVVASEAPEKLRGSAFGLLAAVQSFGNLGASVFAGLLWTLVSPTVAFAFLAAMMAGSLSSLARVDR